MSLSFLFVLILLYSTTFFSRSGSGNTSAAFFNKATKVNKR